MQSYLVFIQKTNILRGRDGVSREVRERFLYEIMEAKSNISIQFIINIIQTQDRNLIKRKFAKFSNCTVKIYGSEPAHEGEERWVQTTENEFVNTNLRTIFGPRLPSLCSVLAGVVTSLTTLPRSYFYAVLSLLTCLDPCCPTANSWFTLFSQFQPSSSVV